MLLQLSKEQNHREKSVLIALALCVAACSAPASAQDSGIFGIDSTSGYNSLLAYAQIKHNSPGALDPLSVRNRYLKRKGRGGRVASGGSRPAPRVSTRFRSSLSARRNTFARFVARARAVSPSDADKLQRAYGTSNPIAPLMPALANYGLRPDDVADATALYLAFSWYGARGLAKDPPRAYVRAVRNQMARSYGRIPTFASTSNAVKQQIADSLLIQTLVVGSSLNAAKLNPALMAQTKNAIRQGALNAFKIDMTKLKLTAQGLRS